MRVDLADKNRGKREKSSLPLLNSFIAMFACAYMLGGSSLSGTLPLPVDRALTNLRKDFDAVGETTGRTVSGLYETVTSIISGR